MTAKLSLQVALVSLSLSLAATPAFAQDPAPPVAVEVSPLGGPLHRLQCNGPLGVAVVASVGRDGVLLVDTGYAGTAPALREAVARLSSQPVRVIVNTHGDGDHVGANAAFEPAPVIVAHPGTREQMSTFFALPDPEREGLPTLTLEDEARIHFNGDTLRLLPVPGAHTAGDLVVHFTGHGLACLGDLVFTGGVPNADPARGGDARRLLEVLRLLEQELPEDTTLLPAHGEAMTMTDLRDYVAMVQGTVTGVQEGVAAGEPLEEIVQRPSLGRWARWQPDRDAFDRWTGEIHSALAGNLRPSVCAPMTEALVRDDVAAAVATYRRLKADEAERWSFGENELNRLGYQLLQRGRVDEALVIFELNVEAYPEAFNTWDSLGEAQLAAGREEQAIASYRRSLELNPDNANAAAVLAGLEAR